MAAAGGEADHREPVQTKPVGQGVDIVGPTQRRPSRWAASAGGAVGRVALYLAGELLFKQRMHSTLSFPRLVAIGVLLAALPAAIALPPLIGLAGSVLILAALIVVETTGTPRPGAASATHSP